jgi:hypothetical protein
MLGKDENVPTSGCWEKTKMCQPADAGKYTHGCASAAALGGGLWGGVLGVSIQTNGAYMGIYGRI